MFFSVGILAKRQSALSPFCFPEIYYVLYIDVKVWTTTYMRHMYYYLYLNSIFLLVIFELDINFHINLY
jgi:hypothetical protein